MALDWGSFLTSAGQGLGNWANWRQQEDERKRQLRLQGIYNKQDVMERVPETRTFEMPENGAALAQKIAIPEQDGMPAVDLQLQQSMKPTTVAPTGNTIERLPQGATEIGGGEVFIPSRSLAGIVAQEQYGRQRELAEWEAQRAMERERTVWGWQRQATQEDLSRQNRAAYETGRGGNLGGIFASEFDPNQQYGGAEALLGAKTRLAEAAIHAANRGQGGQQEATTWDEYWQRRAPQLLKVISDTMTGTTSMSMATEQAKRQAASEWLAAHPGDPQATLILQSEPDDEDPPPQRPTPNRWWWPWGSRTQAPAATPPSAPAAAAPSSFDTSSVGRRPGAMTPQQYAAESQRMLNEINPQTGQRYTAIEVFAKLGPPPIPGQ